MSKVHRHSGIQMFMPDQSNLPSPPTKMSTLVHGKKKTTFPDFHNQGLLISIFLVL